MSRKIGHASRLWFGIVVFAVVGAGDLAAIPRASAADTCGGKENPCPLQKWMRANIGAPLAGNDTKALATNLAKVAASSPDATWTWSKIAKDGADAAGKGEIAGVKASCKSCHDLYKEKYKTQFRGRPAPN